MLNEYKKIYEENANLIGDWKNQSILQLANKYLEIKDTDRELSNSYVSAIVCKYWYLIGSYYSRQQYKFASQEDCYEWLVGAITYVLERHVWTDPNSSIYNDPEGPNKAILVCINSERSNFYEASKRDKRILNNKKLNFSQMDYRNEDESETSQIDRILPSYIDHIDSDYYLRKFIKEKIIEEFSHKEYFNAFALDAIINYNIFRQVRSKDRVDSYVDRKRFRRYFNRLSDDFCRYFSEEYGLNEDLVRNSVKYVRGITNDRFGRNLNSLYKKLSRDSNLRAYLNI